MSVLGNLIASSSLPEHGSVLSQLCGTVRKSVGAGLLIPTAFGRLELNMCRPLSKEEHDPIQRFQIGFGLNFAHF